MGPPSGATAVGSKISVGVTWPHFQPQAGSWSWGVLGFPMGVRGGAVPAEPVGTRGGAPLGARTSPPLPLRHSWLRDGTMSA